ncbi:MAG: hypothetical protein AAF587_21965 [Bacteroidota bacterium]
MDTLYQDSIPYFGNGSSQSSRTLPALLPDYAKIDQRNLADLLAFAASYAKLLNHYNDKNEVSGNWESFFTSDISVVLATIVSTDLETLEREHQQLVAEIGQSYQEMEKYGRLRELFEQILGIATKIDTWFKQVSKINISYKGLENTVAQDLYNIIEIKLRAHLQKLIAYDVGAGEKAALGGPMGLSYEHFDALWEAHPDHITPENIFEGDNLIEKLNNALVKLRLLYRAFYNVLSYLVFNFANYFDASLKDKSNHKPDIALFIVFLHLFKHAQHDLNYVSARHLEFYYDHFLLQKRRTVVPDQAYVCFNLSSHVKSYLVEEGTGLRAGRNSDGSDIIFRTEKDITLNHAQIESLRTMYVGKVKEIGASSYQLVTGMYAAPVANSSDGIGTPFPEDYREWPTFGEEQYDKHDAFKTMGEANIGLAIASPTLFMKEGNREANIRLNFVDTSAHIYRKLVQDIKNVSGVSDEEAFQMVFPERGKEGKNISLFYSTEEGWREIAPHYIKILSSPGRWSSYQINFKISLPQSEPAWVGYEPSLYEGERAYPTRYPVLKILLNHQTEPFPYSYLKDLKISTIDIDVSVDRIRDIRLFNELGQLDPNTPFQPFGPLPTEGSYMMVGNAEVFRKPITELTFHYDWQNIPPTDAAFQKYYSGFKNIGDDTEVLDIKSQDFQIAFSALSQNSFSPGPDDLGSVHRQLFSVKEKEDDNNSFDNDAQDISKCEIHLGTEDLMNFGITPDPRLAEVQSYSNQVAAGYFRLELIDPPHAFGHQLYQTIFADVITHNANPANKDPLAQRAVPNQPYTPTLKSLHLSYKASTQIDVQTQGDRSIPEQVFHVHPFGLETIYSRGSRQVNEEDMYLLPQYTDDAYLYIGLRDLAPPQTISLLFQLTTSKHKGSTRFQVPEVEWSYLSKNTWIPFKTEHHLSDTTYGFTQKGIVQLFVPHDISKRNDTFPSGIYWLRVAVDGDTEVLCHALDVRAQAMKVIWENNGNEERLKKALSSNSISTLIHAKSEISSITQPFPSFGGSQVEEDREYFGRVSERLRTKGRGITHWDLERLTLSKFHTLKQVKCLTHLSHSEVLSTEDGITLVVIPGKNDSPDPTTPKVNYKTLADIESYLSNHISPFANLKVRNPQYEFLRVYCKIKFVEGRNNGETMKKLGKDLEAFLCPWVADDSQDLKIGASISEEMIHNFIKGLPYVVFVTKFSILHIVRNEAEGRYTIRDTAKETEYVSILQAQPWGVLISDTDHGFELTFEEKEEAPSEIPTPIRFQGKRDITKDADHIVIKPRLKPKVIGRKSTKTTYTLTINL